MFDLKGCYFLRVSSTHPWSIYVGHPRTPIGMSEFRFDDLKGQRMLVLACVTDPSQVNTRRPRPPRLRCSLRSNYLKGQRMSYLACVIDRSLVVCLGLLTCDTWYWTASVDGSHSRVTCADTPLTADGDLLHRSDFG
jgi:hypothetical protein